ncbi:Six-hairpin glycosidase [Aureobasidium pullulans]|nr:Six-hairpin glycosidase [Aureobasidium pullulans]
MTPKLLSLFAATAAVAQTLQCPQNVHGQASQMMTSNIARSQGAAASSSGTGLIELGIFYQALRESIAATNNTADKQAWTAYLHNSTATAIPLFTNATSAIGLPLDRFSIGTEMMRQSHETQSASLLSAISTLQDSLAQQPRNTNGGLWYYDNQNNLTAYRNLSYTDGMYSYPTFAILSAGNGTRQSDAVGPATSSRQSVRLNILEDTKLRNKAIKAGVGLWENIFDTHVTRNANGTLDLGGTSSIASLSPQIVNAKVRYELNFPILPIGNVDSFSQYYFDRPTANNSLIGTSAFTLASLELEKLCG